MKKLCLVDGHSYLYRAFYAIKNIYTKTGQPTGAVLGFINMLLKIIQKEKPHMLMIAFDSPKPTFRREKYSEYKANRKKMPDELISQIPLVKEVIDALNIHYIELAGFEADDIIGTVALEADKNGIEFIVIHTNDKDMLQLVNNHIFVQTESGNSTRYNTLEVIKRFGIPPEHVPDMLALTGDTSDNIPGVPGIGPKTASSLIKEFGTLENLLNSTCKIKKTKLQNLLEKYKDDALISCELAKLHTELPLDIDFDNLKIKEYDYIKLDKILKKLEFNNLIDKLIPQEFKLL
ncbi:MAG: hypothetical protein HY934_01420 [Candidatus Firestonebacteria bacterium]|nr:hypothetical protein [Candidatus Firestonebacteria bacterium]